MMGFDGSFLVWKRMNKESKEALEKQQMNFEPETSQLQRSSLPLDHGAEPVAWPTVTRCLLQKCDPTRSLLLLLFLPQSISFSLLRVFSTVFHAINPTQLPDGRRK